MCFDSSNGVHIDDGFQTANPDIFACGDCATAYKFTHAADFQARLAVRNMFLGDSNRLSDMLIPWCKFYYSLQAHMCCAEWRYCDVYTGTYTHPEVAHVGKYEAELEGVGIEYETFVRELPPVDR